MRVADILNYEENCCEYEAVWINENDEIIQEKDMTQYVAKEGKHFFVDRTDFDTGKVLVKPGDIVTFTHNKKTFNATVSDNARGRDDDSYQLYLHEGAIRQWKRVSGKLVRKYRCLAGKKKGKLVASPMGCGQRKDPRRVRIGRKVMRSKKGIIGRKAKISKRQSISKRLRKMNARLMGKTV